MPPETRSTRSQILTFNDFSPGIVQRVGILGSVANSPSPLGAASITNTYRCIALPGGGLGPLPKQESSISYRALSTPALPGGVTARALGFLIYGPMFKETAGDARFPPLTSTPYEMHLIYEYVDGVGQDVEWRKYPFYSGDNSVQLHTDTQTASPTSFGTAYLISASMNPSAPTSFGFPVVVVSWNQSVAQNEGNDFGLIYPDPTDLTTAETDTPFDIGWSTVGPIVAHQNRIVSMSRGRSVHGDNGGVMPINERIFWTKFNDYIIESGSPAQFGPEFPFGYGAWGSLNASDLLLIKHAGGALLIQGDLNNPIVRRFPSVQGTHGVEVLGCPSPVGFIYGSKSDGVYSWQGGDSAVLLSPQLEDGFWQVSGLGNHLYAGGFIAWGDLVICPNNFILDSNSGSWWRLQDPTVGTFYSWDVDKYNNTLFGLSPTFSEASPTVAATFKTGTPAINFSWQSQPFTVSNRRRFRIRGVYLTAQGTGTVTITFTSDEGSQSQVSQPNVANISTTGPTRAKLPCDILGTELVMRIVSDGAAAAPIVYSIDLEVEESSNLSPV